MWVSGLKHVREKFAHMRAVDLTPEMNKALALRAAYNLGLKEELLSKIPRFTILKEGNARKGFFEKKEFEVLLKCLNDPYDELFLFAYLNGWRKGQIVVLRWNQVDHYEREIRLDTSKNGEGLVIRISWRLSDLIKVRRQKMEVKSKSGGTYFSLLVFHEKGKMIGDIRKRWNKACKMAGYPEKLFHDFRLTDVPQIF